MEVLRAHDLQKPIITFSQKIRPEKWNPWMAHHSTVMLESLDEAIKYIQEKFT